MIDGRLNFDTKINTNGFSSGLKTLDGQMKGLQNTAVKLAGALAGAFSVKQVIEYAAEVKALNSQFEQTFGDLQDEAQAAINKVSESSQILDTRLKSTASSIYAFAKANGMDSQTALTMMGDALEVTADSAAYYDRSLEETGETLKSFLKGNYANDAALGIACTETTRNIAANKLYGKSFKDLSEAQKQLTLLQMVKDANAASGALGQAAREADGWENVLGNLKEAWKQLLAVIGQPILAAVIPVIKNITSSLQQLTSIAKEAASAVAAVFGLELDTSDLSALSSGAGDVSDAIEDLLDVTDGSDISDELESINEQLEALGDKARQVEREVDLDGARAAMAAVSDTSAAIAAGAENSAESYDEMADAAKKAEKANKGSLASFDKINKLGGGDDESVTASEKTADDAERSRRVAAQAEEIEEVFRKINNLRKIYDTSEEEALKQKEEYLNRLRSSGALLEENDKRYSAEFENEQANIIAEQREEYYRQLQDQYDEEYAAQKKALEEAKKAAEKNDTSKAAEQASESAKKTSDAAVKLVDKLSGKSSLEKKLTGIISSVKALLEKIFEPFKKSWDKYGESVIDSIKNSFLNVWELVKSIGKSFIEVWSNGTGEEIVGHILGIFSKINDYNGNLAESFRKAWDNNNIGTDIVQHAADIFNTILSHIENIAAAWAEWAGEVNFSPLLEAFDHLEQAVKPIVDDLGSWFEDINNDLLIPLATWTTETLIPTALDSIAKALEGLHAAWETAYPVVKEKLWDKFLKPLAKWAGEKSVQLIKEFGDAIKEWGENLTEKDVELLIDLAEAVGALTVAVKGAAIIKGFGGILTKGLSGLGSMASFLGSDIGVALGTSISGTAIAVIAAAIGGWSIGTMIRDAIGEDNVDDFLFEVFDTVVAWWNDFSTFWTGIGTDIVNGYNSLIEELSDYFLKTKEGFDNAIEEVKETFREFGSFFTEDIPGWWDSLQSDTLFPIYDKISEVWERCKKFFTEDIPGWWDTLQSDTLFPMYDKISEVWEKCKKFFTEDIPAWWDTLQSDTLFPIYDKALAVWNSVKDFFTQQIPEFFTVTIPQFFSDSWDKITSIFSLSNVQKHFTNIVNKIKAAFGKIGSFFKDIFKNAWGHVTAAFDLNNAKTLFSNVASKMAEGFSHIVSLIKSPVNGVIDVFNFLMDAISSGFNAVTGVIEDLVNSVADTVNALSFDIPDWAGGGTLGFDMPHVTIPEISIPHLPKLATGTVVPANYGEFAAILGDNKRETEVVSPLSTIKQALVQALRESGAEGGDIYIYLDGEELAYSMERRAGKRSKRTGKGG